MAAARMAGPRFRPPRPGRRGDDLGTWLGGHGSSRPVQAVGQYAVLRHFEPRGGRHESAHKVAQSELADAVTMGRAELRGALRYYEALPLGKG